MHGHFTIPFDIILLDAAGTAMEQAGFTLHAPTLEAALDNITVLMGSPMAPEARAAVLRVNELDLSTHPQWSAAHGGLLLPRQ